MINRQTIQRAMIALFLMTGSVATFAQEAGDDTDTVGETTKTSQSSFAVSVNGGLNFSYTDVKPSKSAITFGIGGTYMATPYLHVNLDLQKGWIKGGEFSDAATNTMGSDNSIFSVALTGRFLPLRLIRDNNKALAFFSGLYGGTGLGLVSSSVKANVIPSPDYGSLKEFSGATLMWPIEAGINLPVAKLKGGKSVLINLNYRINLCFSDKIDGYVPTVESNKKNDAYNSLTAGVVFAF